MLDAPRPQLAMECVWLERRSDFSQPSPFSMICGHFVREGSDCVGPFVQGIGTDCRLWDPREETSAPTAQRNQPR